MGQGISEVTGRPNMGRTSMGQGISKVKVARISQAGNDLKSKHVGTKNAENVSRETSWYSSRAAS